MNSRSKLKRKRQIRRRVGLVMVCGVLVVYNIISYNVSKKAESDTNTQVVEVDENVDENIDENSNQSVNADEEVNNNDNNVDIDTSDEQSADNKVDENYFSDAIFIGDSRTEGFILSTGLCGGYSIAAKGLNVKSVFDKQCIKAGDRYITAIDAIRNSQFNKAYLMFGINETGWQSNETFINYYKKIIEEIKRCNPNAIIYVQAILPVSKEVSDSSEYIKKSRIDELNSLIKLMAEEEKVFYLEVNECVADTGGYLPSAAANDGIHLNKEYCMKWYNYLCEHVNG